MRSIGDKNFTEQQKHDVFDEIITELVNGKTIADILNSKKHYPSSAVFFKWLQNDPQLKEVYAYAREVLAHKLFDELIEIARGDSGDDTICRVQRDRLKTDTIKFYIAKILPKVYGERVDITSNGEAINVLSLGVGIAPPQETTKQEYIDITPTYIGEGNE
jgi:hypothetical protein